MRIIATLLALFLLVHIHSQVFPKRLPTLKDLPNLNNNSAGASNPVNPPVIPDPISDPPIPPHPPIPPNPPNPPNPITPPNPNPNPNPPNPPNPSNNQPNPKFLRLRDIQADGESLADTMARLSPSIPSPPVSGFQTTTPATESGRRLLVSDAVQNLLDTYMVPSSIGNYDYVTGTTTGTTTGKNCTYEGHSYSSPTNSFIHIDQSSIDIYPGSILQSQYVNDVMQGTQSQVPVPASGSTLNPTITIFSHADMNYYTVDNDGTKVANLASAIIGSLYQAPIFDYQIVFEIGTSDDLGDYANRLGFNCNMQKRLGLYRQPGQSFTSINKKIILLFTKSLGTFEVNTKAQQPSLPNTPLNAFFSPGLTYSEALYRTPSWWSIGNAPIFINLAIYGSLIAMTVDFNAITAPIYESMQYAADDAALQVIFNKLIAQPTLKYFSVGPFSGLELSAIKSGNWINFFTVPNFQTNQLGLHPYLYTIKNFKNTRHNAANSFNYVKICATPLPIIPHNFYIIFENILYFAPVILRIYKILPGGTLVQTKVEQISFPVSYWLTNWLWEDQMIVTIEALVGQQCWFCPLQQKAKVSFWVDGVVTPKINIDCVGNCQNYVAGSYTVDRVAGTVTP